MCFFERVVVTDETLGDEWAPGIPDEPSAPRARTFDPAHAQANDLPQPVDVWAVGRDGGAVSHSQVPVYRPGDTASHVDRYPVTDAQAPSYDAAPEAAVGSDPLDSFAEDGPMQGSPAYDPGEPSSQEGHGEAGAGNALAEELATGFQRLENRIESLHEDRSTLESMIRGLQSRNEELQGDLVMRALTPIVKELAVLQGQARRIAKEAADRFEAFVASDIAFDFDDFADRIGEATDSLGVEAMGVTAGDPFDRRRHQASGRVPTSDESLDKCVASVIHEGYWASGTEKPVVYAKVRLHQYQAPEPTGSGEPDADQVRSVAATDGPESIPLAAEDPWTQQDNKENEQ